MPGKFDFMEGLEPTGLKEREIFYKNEFELQSVRNWLSHREFEDEKKDIYTDIEECKRCGNCYRNCWDCSCYLGQELAFDIDPENVTCPIHGTLDDKLEKGIATKFCMYEFEAVKNSTVKLWEILEKDFNKMRVVYSGRGFHIHVLDDEAVEMTYEEQKSLAHKASKLHIDEWVTSGDSRLIRLPYSLSGIVSRIVTPLEIDEVPSFDPRYDKRAIPKYIQEKGWKSKGESNNRER